MAQEWWQAAPVVEPQSIPGYIPGRQKAPDPLALRRDERAADAADRAANNSARLLENDAQRINREAARDARQTSQDGFNNATKLADDYNRDAAVKAYMQAVPAYASALTSSPNPQGDLNLIYAFAKVLDPDSVVREGEAASVASSDTIYGRTVARLQKELGEGGTFSDTARENLRQELRLRIAQLNDAYIGTRNRYKDQASRFGIDPVNVVGEHFGKRFQDTEAQFLGRPVREGDYRGNPITPTAAQRPAGEIEFGNPGGAPPNSSEYQRAVEAGIADGSIRSPEQLQAVADRFGVGQIDPMAAAKTFEALRNGARFAGAEAPQFASVERDRAEMDRTRKDAIVDPLIRGAADTATLGLADEISAAGQTVLGGGTMAENLARQRAVDAFDSDNNPVPRAIGQVAGGFALPSFGASTPAQLAALGAGYAGGYGFGSGDGSVTDRLINAGLSAPVGAAGGYIGGRASQYLAGRVPPPGPQRGSDIAQAAIDQGVDIVRPDAQPATRGFYSFAESLPFSGGRVRSDLQRGTDQMAARLAQVGGGAATPRPAAGAAIRQAGERYIARSRSTVDRAYARAESAAGNTTITPASALANIDQQIADLSQTPQANAAKLQILNRLRADMVDDTGAARALPVGAIRNLRTAMRDELNAAGLRATDAERRVGMVLDDANRDIQAGLSGTALRSYQRADRLHRERVTMIDDVVKRFLGPRNAGKSDEQVAGVVDRMSAPRSGDERRLASMMNTLDRSERQQVTSSIAGVLGRGGDGAADFSPQRFFTEIKRFSPEAREAVFGAQGARDLAQLATLAEARAGTVSRMNNSGSGRVSNWMTAITSVLSGGGLGGVAGAATGIGAGSGLSAGAAAAPAVLGGVYLRARALGDPRFIHALVNASRAPTPQLRQRAVDQMTRLATREPALASDIMPVASFLQNAIGASPGRVAAGENVDR